MSEHDFEQDQCTGCEIIRGVMANSWCARHNQPMSSTGYYWPTCISAASPEAPQCPGRELICRCANPDRHEPECEIIAYIQAGASP